jgi:F-type H+-transporting ATPase subunit delta
VIDNGRLAALPEIAAQFQALVNASSRRVRRHGLQRLPDRRRATRRRGGLAGEALRPQAQGQRVEVKPELIGGIRVVVGDEVLDTSVKARLEQMKVALTASRECA